jgi:hypothetical protein
MSSTAKRNNSQRPWTFVIENSRGGQIIGVDFLDFVIGMWNGLHVCDGSDEMYQLHYNDAPINLVLIPVLAAENRETLLTWTPLPVEVIHMILDQLYGPGDRDEQNERKRPGFDWSRWPLAYECVECAACTNWPTIYVADHVQMNCVWKKGSSPMH